MCNLFEGMRETEGRRERNSQKCRCRKGEKGSSKQKKLQQESILRQNALHGMLFSSCGLKKLAESHLNLKRYFFSGYGGYRYTFIHACAECRVAKAKTYHTTFPSFMPKVKANHPYLERPLRKYCHVTQTNRR